MATVTTIPAQTGRCLCGAVTFEHTVAPVFTAVCYCDDDAKLSTSTVLQVPEQGFKITSMTQPKKFTMTSDFDREISSHFCPECGVTLFRTGGAKEVQGLVGIRGGCLDDQASLRAKPPAIEVFVEKRPTWRNRIEGAVQLDSKYNVVAEENVDSTLIDDAKRKAGGS